MRYLLGDFIHLKNVILGSPDNSLNYPGRLSTLLNFLKFIQKGMFYDNLSLSDPMVGIRTWLDLLTSPKSLT